MKPRMRVVQSGDHFVYMVWYGESWYHDRNATISSSARDAFYRRVNRRISPDYLLVAVS